MGKWQIDLVFASQWYPGKTLPGRSVKVGRECLLVRKGKVDKLKFPLLVLISYVLSFDETINLTFPDHVVERLLLRQSINSFLGQIGQLIRYQDTTDTYCNSCGGILLLLAQLVFHRTLCLLLACYPSYFFPITASTSTINYFSNVTFQ